MNTSVELLLNLGSRFDHVSSPFQVMTSRATGSMRVSPALVQGLEVRVG